MSIFAEKIYKQLKKIPKGRVTTYGFLARSVDSKLIERWV